MKLSLTSLTALLGFTASAAAYTGASVFDHVNDIKAAVLENRDTFRPVEEPKLEKRNSRFLNADTKSEVTLLTLDNRLIILQNSSLMAPRSRKCLSTLASPMRGCFPFRKRRAKLGSSSSGA